MITENFKGAARGWRLVTGSCWLCVPALPEGDGDPRPATRESRASNFLLRRKFTRLVLEHHRDVVLDRVAEAARLANQFGLGLAVQQRTLAQRAYQYVEQLGVHAGALKD